MSRAAWGLSVLEATRCLQRQVAVGDEGRQVVGRGRQGIAARTHHGVAHALGIVTSALSRGGGVHVGGVPMGPDVTLRRGLQARPALCNWA